METIADELIYEILLKLPVKSLWRFRCVCKSWKNLISNPQFVTDHLHINMPRHERLASFVDDGHNQILTCSVQSLIETPSTPAATLTFKMDRKYCIIGSINGLLCLYDSENCFRLWNPTTRLESKRSPPPPNFSPDHVSRFGFGYDQVNNKYKVVVHVFDHHTMETKVHTFGTDSWRTIKNIPCDSNYQLGKFVSGTLNWLTPSMILSFDMENETYGKVSLPNPGDDDYCFYNLDILNNCLCLCVSDCSQSNHLVLWLMKKYGVKESWTKLIVNPFEKYFHPLCISENGLILARDMRAHIILLYNRNNGTSHYLDILQQFGKYIQVYHESLVSP